MWDSAKFGKVLTGSGGFGGFTPHRFGQDAAGPPKSNCEGDCAKVRPRVHVGNVTAAVGTGPALVGRITRTDGSRQLALG
ncbi:hypothetical protein FHX80_115835 [Streptomyces brevispora]|uniref:Uncharacterized protein n=1 Tax=Streptomyces brevispora TaxID=887462 RepID=A0A561V6V7_9ACTN|nr:hypothetical protein FHX80_115835 [Streptomyces brevispora]